MEKATRRTLAAIAALTAGFLLFAGGFFLGRRQLNDGYTVITEYNSPAPRASEVHALPEATEVPAVAGAVININTATSAELETLNGIGPSLAAAIIERREAVGGFRHTYELLDVKGVGEKIYERIKNNITVGEVTDN